MNNAMQAKNHDRKDLRPSLKPWVRSTEICGQSHGLLTVSSEWRSIPDVRNPFSFAHRPKDIFSQYFPDGFL